MHLIGTTASEPPAMTPDGSDPKLTRHRRSAMKTLATALMLSMSVLAAGAQAAEADQGPSRAQVQAELQQAKVSGQYTFGEEGYPAAIPQKSSLTSQQVQAELAQAKNAGEVTFGNLDYPPVAAAE